MKSNQSRSLTWKDFQKVVQAKTFYIALLILLLSIAFFGLSFTQQGFRQAVLLAIASTLLTSSIFSIVSEAMVRLDVVEYVDAGFSALEQAIREREPSDGCSVTVFLSRREVDWADFIANARGVVQICGFSANDILSAPNCDRFFDALSVGKVDKLEVILLDSTSILGQARSEQPAYLKSSSLESKRSAVLAEIEILKERLSKLGLHDRIANADSQEAITVSMVCDARFMYVTPIVRNKTGGTSATFRMDSAAEGADLANFYREHMSSLRTSVGW